VIPDADHAALTAYANRQLTREEVDAWLSTPISDEERAHVLELVDWFCRRYPEPADRLAYARRAYARWTASRPSPPTKST
jgi:hypothetical protein